MTIRFHTHLQPIAEGYDALILDLWGVIHDGAQVYPGAIETLRELRRAKKRIIFLSNAPRRAAKVIEVLDTLGVDSSLYEHVVCSGEAAYRHLSRVAGLNYYYLGPQRDAGIADGLPHRRVEYIKDAEFILNTGHPKDDPSIDLDPILRAAAGKNIPLLCLNPDTEVVKLNGERCPCAGVIAERYEELGGRSAYFGKPYAEVYQLCMQYLGNVPRNRILAVGDGLFTDIAGAEQAGIASAIITGGLLREELGSEGLSHVLQEKLSRYCQEYEIMPDYALPGLIWE